MYPLPKVLNASNVKMKLRAVDISMCFIHLILTFSVNIPMIKKWDTEKSISRTELESKVSSSAVFILSLTGTAAAYAAIVALTVIMILDMVNASAIRKLLLSFATFDEQVFTF